ncbi:MAG: endonuclease V [Deltaproteobacteria bacterium]|nr:endonuclease V [Deltaproteobacteria bacterium]
MIAFVDVGYADDVGVAACVVAARWTDDRPFEERVVRVSPVSPYEPGRFFLRELPCVRAVLGEVHAPVDVLVVDGYVFLDGDRPGLGARLHGVLQLPVVGVAKTPFRGVTSAVAVTRGQSTRPLFVSAIGIDVREAAERVREMHGAFRVPTLLRRVDRLSRS